MSSCDDDIKIQLSKEQKQIIQKNLDENGRLSCIKAMKVAKKIGEDRQNMSAITKSLDIKITNCELGVFGKLKFQEASKDIYDEILSDFGQKEIKCEDLWNESKKTSLKKVGSTVKNSDLEVTYCQLGCFREKKGLKNKKG